MNALLVNQIGLAYFNKGRFQESVPYFEIALKEVTTEANFLNNLVLAHRNTGHPAKALEIYEKHHAPFQDNLSIKSLRPVLLSALERKEEAVEAYREVFKKGYRAEDELLDFLTLLAELGKFEEAIETVDSFLQNSAGASLRVRR